MPKSGEVSHSPIPFSHSLSLFHKKYDPYLCPHPKDPLVLMLLLILESSVPPTALATLITAQALRPPQFLPLIFPPLLLFSTYLNISDYKVEAAGTNAAWSGLYLLLARRRKQPLARKFGTRGLIRGATLGMCAANLVCGGWVYAVGKRRGEGDDSA